MSDKTNKSVNEIFKDAANTIQEGSRKVIGFANKEMEKTKLRSDIGHTNRELAKAYEKLGRDYYASKVLGEDIDLEESLHPIITSEATLKELKNDLDALSADNVASSNVEEAIKKVRNASQEDSGEE